MSDVIYQEKNLWREEVIPKLNDPDSNVRSWATEALGNLPSTDSSLLPDLIAALDHTPFPAPHTIATVLARFGPAAKPAIPSLIRLLTTKPQWIFHSETTADMPAQCAMEALVAIGEATVPALRDTLRAGDEQTRLLTTWALGKVAQTTPTAVPVLMQALRDKDRWIAAQAGHALGECGAAATDAISLLSDVVTDRDVFVRAEATHALSKIKSGFVGDYSEIVTELTNILKNGEERLRAKSAHTLGHLGREARTAVASLISALEVNDEPLLEAVAALSINAGSILVPAYQPIVFNTAMTVPATGCIVITWSIPLSANYIPTTIFYK